MAFFDRAAEYSPYLAVAAGGALFLVKTVDKHIARSLFSKQGRGEFAVLGRAVAAIEGLQGAKAVTNRVFVDVGANIGTTTIPALRSHGFSTALAIEPEPENFQVLRLNILLNGLEEQVISLPVAVSNKVGRSELVVNRERGGKHRIATALTKLNRKESGPETTIVTVETVTLDHLVEAGVIDPEDTGLLWMDAEAHEGHILEGASRLLERGTPLVLEWNPSNLDRVSGRDKIQRAVAENYTHFACMQRNREPEQPNYPLEGVDHLSEYAERFLGTSGSPKTDILVLRLEHDRAPGSKSLDAVLKRSPADGPAPDGLGIAIARPAAADANIAAMAQGDRQKPEKPRKAERPTKAERRMARQAKQARRAGAAPPSIPEDMLPEERVEQRLARLEEAVAAQAERSEELLAKVDELLQESAGTSEPSAR